MFNSATKGDRKFHDAWAFYLYIIVTIIMNTFFLVNTSNIESRLGDLFTKTKFGGVYLANLLFTVCLIMIMLLLCYFIPKFFIVLSILAFPIISIVLFVYFDLKSHDHALIIGFSLFIINVILLIFAGFTILPFLDYIAVSLSIASKLFFKNLFTIIFMQIVCFILAHLLVVSVFISDSNDDLVQKSRYLTIFFGLWTGGIILIFMKVFISSIIVSEMKNHENGIFSSALNNSVYALGSISYGALIIAVINVLKIMVAESREKNDRKRRNREGGSRNILSAILLAIASCLLNILGDIVKFANSIAFPYLSVYGTNYKESVIQSYQILASGNLEKIAAYHGLDFVIILVTSLSIPLYYIFNQNFIFKTFGITDSDFNVFWSIIVDLIIFFFILFSLLKSAVMTLIFAAASFNKELEKFSPEFNDILEEEKRKINCCRQEWLCRGIS